MNYRFYLRAKNTEESYIYLDIRHNEDRLRMPIGLITIKTKNWDKKKQIVKLNSKYASVINSKLNNISQNIQDYILTSNKTDYSVNEVSNLVNNSISPEIVGETQLIDKVSDFILRLSNEYSTVGSVKKLLNLRSILKQHNPKLKFSEINIKELENFNNFLIKKKYSNTYIIRTVALFKTTLRKYNQFNPKFDISFLLNHRNKVSNKTSTLIALDESEISKLYDYKGIERNEIIRDLFIVQCYLGVRISDLLNIKKENIDIKNSEVLLMTIKTSELIRIPISKKILPIFEQYNYILPKISDVKYNLHIKEVCQSVGIDTPTLITSWRGGNRIDEIKPKYELISSHTARRTFITRLLRKGLLPEQIMKITGHRNRRSFDEYVKITQSEAIDAVRNALD